MLSKRFAAALALLTALAAGCGTQTIYPVRGRVLDRDGKPIAGLTGGTVELEAVEAELSANGAIEADGSFVLTTRHKHDGAHVGKHRVAITRPFFGPDTPAPLAVDPKYEALETSQLEIVVEPKSNVVELKVDRYRPDMSD